MKYKPKITEYLKEPCNLLIRLNKEDTITLSNLIDEVKGSRGVSLILMKMRGAISLTESDEQGEQIKLIAFSDKVSFSPNTKQRGYTGKWSHFEIATDKGDTLETFLSFLEKVKYEQKQLGADR